MLLRNCYIIISFSIYLLANCLFRKESKVFDDRRPSTQLTGYIISTLPARDRKNCAIACLQLHTCNSFNYCGKKMCELNSAAQGDVEESSWVDSDSCEYMGTPDDCFYHDPRNETCSRENCTLRSHQFHWGEKPMFEVTEEHNLTWDKFMASVCFNSTNSESMRSNCGGCPPAKTATDQRVLWQLEPKIWNQGKYFCEDLGGTLFAQLGETVKALMDKYTEIGKSPTDPTDRHIFLGLILSGDQYISTETGEAVPFDDILWSEDRPNQGLGYITVG